MSIEQTLPAIVEAADADTIYEAALAYAELGISIIPTRGKEPGVPTWRERQQRRASRGVIDFWHDKGYLTNVGVVCGAVSGNLVVMDLDGEAAFAAYANRFPHLLDTYTVRSGSGHGYHLYYQSEALPPTTRVTGLEAGNVELRANGCYVVAPPSTHPVSGKRYTVARALPVMRVSGMDAVVAWIKRLIADKHGGTMPPARPRPGEVKHRTPWAEAALTAECVTVKHAPTNSRNITLNRAAFKLGQLVGGELLDRDVVEQRLYEAAAALTADDGELATWKTIKSGLDAGINNPRRG